MGGLTTSCTGVKTEYVYDGESQLRRATKKFNGIVQSSEEYWYDQDGQRQNVVKRSNAGAVTEMEWFIGGAEAHYDSVESTTAVYAHVSMGTPVAGIFFGDNPVVAGRDILHVGSFSCFISDAESYADAGAAIGLEGGYLRAALAMIAVWVRSGDDRASSRTS